MNAVKPRYGPALECETALMDVPTLPDGLRIKVPVSAAIVGPGDAIISGGKRYEVIALRSSDRHSATYAVRRQ